MGTPTTAVTGIGPAAAAVLTQHGFDSAEALASAPIDALVKVPGFGPVRAATIQKAAQAAVESNGRDVDAQARGKKSAKGKKAKKQDKKGGKKGSKDKKAKKPKKAKKAKKQKGGKARKAKGRKKR